TKKRKANQRKWHNIENTIECLEEQMKGVTTETTALLQQTNRLADDINGKSEKLNGLFDGVKGIGETVKDFNDSLNTISNKIVRDAGQDTEKASQAVKWGLAIFDIVKRNKK